MVKGTCGQGQTPTTFYDNEQTPYQSALSGGFLAPQFSSFDLNQDGITELITFDRFSGIIQVWAQTEEKFMYVLEEESPVEWPVIRSWMLVRDFNMDGLPDIFTQGFHGIAVYRGYIENDVIKYEKLSGTSFIDDSLIFHNRSGGTTNIYHASSDIPIIEDLDGDGDLDILTFELSGSYLYFYENRHEESGNYLDFVLRHNCWGYFAEDQFSEDINLSDTDLSCPPAFSVRHSGSTSCLLDFNHDSLPDLLLGDIGSGSLKVLINHGSPDTSLITEVVPEFPNQDSPTILHFFPAAYRIDVDQDTIQDIVVAVNDHPSTDQEGLWVYQGTGNNEEPFILQSREWLQSQYIDLGQYSSPCFIDINGDGLQDVLVSYQVTDTSYVPANKIAYFQAIDEDEFQLRNLDFLSLSDVLSSGYRPYLTSGDGDGDGDIDLLAGMSDGTNYMIFNGTEVGRMFQIDRIEKDWAGLHMLSGATPELFDIDRDGDLDVMAGSDNGTIGLYINQGDGSQALFDSELANAPNVRNLGQIRTVGENSLLGRSAPRIVLLGSDTILLSSSHHGELFTYRVRTDDPSSSFPSVNLENGPEWIGGNGRITIRKNSEHSIHVLIGNIAGGLTEEYISLIPTNVVGIAKKDLKLFPNPLHSGQDLNFSQFRGNRGIEEVNLYFMTGTLFRSFDFSAGQTHISTKGWFPGIYFLQIVWQNKTSEVHKVVVH